MGQLLWVRTLELRAEQRLFQVHRAMCRRARAQSQATPHRPLSGSGLSVSPDWAGPGKGAVCSLPATLPLGPALGPLGLAEHTPISQCDHGKWPGCWRPLDIWQVLLILPVILPRLEEAQPARANAITRAKFCSFQRERRSESAALSPLPPPHHTPSSFFSVLSISSSCKVNACSLSSSPLLSALKHEVGSHHSPTLTPRTKVDSGLLEA